MRGPRLTRPRKLSAAAAKRLQQFEFRGGKILPLFESLSHSPVALDDLASGTEASIDNNSLPLRLREILILRTLARWNARAEWDIHLVLYMAVAPLSLAEVEWLGGGRSFIPWTAKERMLIDVADALHDKTSLPDNLWQGLTFLFSESECADIVMTATQYIKVALMTRAFAIPAQQAKGPGFIFHSEVPR